MADEHRSTAEVTLKAALVIKQTLELFRQPLRGLAATVRCLARTNKVGSTAVDRVPDLDTGARCNATRFRRLGQNILELAQYICRLRLPITRPTTVAVADLFARDLAPVRGSIA